MDCWFVFATLGEMNLKEILVECQDQGWAPILIFRKDGKTFVPCFESQENAIKFARRNMPKDQLFGTTLLTDEDLGKLKIEWVEGKNWVLDRMSHPRLVKDVAKLDVEVFEYQSKPDVYGAWGSKCQNTRLISD